MMDWNDALVIILIRDPIEAFSRIDVNKNSERHVRDLCQRKNLNYHGINSSSEADAVS